MVNRVIILGHLGADPELKGDRCLMRVATTERYKDRNGARQEHTEWHNIVVWGAQAGSCAQFLSKGRQVYIDGRIKTRSYDQEGIRRYITEIHATTVRFLGQGRDKQGGQGQGQEGEDEFPND